MTAICPVNENRNKKKQIRHEYLHNNISVKIPVGFASFVSIH